MRDSCSRKMQKQSTVQQDCSSRVSCFDDRGIEGHADEGKAGSECRHAKWNEVIRFSATVAVAGLVSAPILGVVGLGLLAGPLLSELFGEESKASEVEDRNELWDPKLVPETAASTDANVYYSPQPRHTKRCSQRC